MANLNVCHMGKHDAEIVWCCLVINEPPGRPSVPFLEGVKHHRLGTVSSHLMINEPRGRPSVLFLEGANRQRL